jgi:hypothetical protein
MGPRWNPPPGTVMRDDEVDIEPDEFRRAAGEAIVLSVGPTVLDSEVLPLDVTAPEACADAGATGREAGRAGESARGASVSTTAPRREALSAPALSTYGTERPPSRGSPLAEEPALTRARLGLVRGVAQVLRNGLGLLGVDAPESM